METIMVGRYDSPDSNGGWGGWIEPANKEWILFVPYGPGRPEFYGNRDPRTGAVLDAEHSSPDPVSESS